ncbi:hypothetical protein MACK_001049 [Theileria orientalis]|uniref:Uncharacterized protein n=1 Tax=Theileria orientalis TaxID=68886 RepID=A0A976MEC0_THEOR|nr:hypothetical protein MACK_001049 [Theileria orientalis]
MLKYSGTHEIGDDPRPLLVCYNGWAYAAKTMEEYDNQSGPRTEINGRIWIGYRHNCLRVFCFNRYTHTTPELMECSRRDNGKGSDSFTRKIRESVCVTKMRLKSDVVMCSGECNKLECNLYYILKDRAGKKYEKGSNGLTMDDDTKLGKELEKALFTNSKHLRVCGQRPGAKAENENGKKEFAVSSDAQQPEKPGLNRYKAQLLRPTEVNCHKSYSDAGYRCFQHQLMNAENIEQGKQGSGPEITLCTGNGTAGKNGSNCQNGKNGQKIDVTYTTCKGDLYVFFYGEDPRPLMLCYDNNAAGPLPGTGELDIPFRADPKVLKALYDVSQFMNPVRLCLGPDAYNTLDPQHGQQQQLGQSEGPKQWSYAIDTNPPHSVCVRVTGIDLRCYKQYVHRPAIDGYRLGAVTYAGAVDAGEGSQEAAKPTQNGTQCGESDTRSGWSTRWNLFTCSTGSGPLPLPPNPFCFEYDSSKQLWSVCVYYYMYDIGHKWPLVVELGFRGQSSEFYRLCCAGDNGAGSTAGNGVNGANGECKAPKGLRWVKMAHTTQKTDQGDCGTCPQGADNANNGGETPEAKAETCKKDAEFVKRAREIHHAIYSDQSPSSVFLGDRVPLESDLNDLIERRAFEIRTQLGIEYTKEEKCLILATSSRCWEGWPLGYMVGGGFLGVAGGGGWKIAVAVLGLVVPVQALVWPAGSGDGYLALVRPGFSLAGPVLVAAILVALCAVWLQGHTGQSGYRATRVRYGGGNTGRPMRSLVTGPHGSGTVATILQMATVQTRAWTVAGPT